MTNIALIGFGEVGQILGQDLAVKGAAVSAWDPKFADAASGPSRAAQASGVRKAKSAADAAAGARLVISAVTAAQDVAAARAAAVGISPKAFYLDFNSCSPGMKRESAHVIEAEGGRYVEGAVMSPYPPKRLGTATLLGGPHAEDLLPLAREVGFTGMSVFSDALGKASAAKMCRSVMIKGIEALLSESLLSARHYGVEDTVLASLQDLFPGPDWPTLSRYMISRTLEHGVRRAEEMREVARTMAEAGVEPLMSEACAKRQDWAPQFAEALEQEDLKAMLDAMRALMADADAKR
jgi:3-hydroxyisobutyrate dehydrogenase-like beta-hydroxyacid dehydrogenase